MNWNPEYFSKIGYLGLMLSVGVLVLWLIYLRKPGRLWGTLALAFAVVSFVFARNNSQTHVNRIVPDRSEEVAKQAAQEQARRQALLDSRGDEVAKVQFIEDGANDFLDRAGMDEADLKYFESQGGFGEPDWKGEKKKRTNRGGDDSLESEIGGKQVIGGVESDEFAEDEKREPIVMNEEDLVMANRLDLLNLRVTLVLLLVAICVVVFDYLRRGNIYGKSSRPLPLPSSWLNALTPMPSLVISKMRSRKSARGELARLAKRGDSFLYLTDDPARLKKLPSALRRFPLIGKSEELISMTADVDNDFVFETIWFGLGSFVVGDQEKSLQLLEFFLDRFEQRTRSRARVTQTAHLVWDLETPMPPQLQKASVKLAEATGFSILVLRDKKAGKGSRTQPSAQSAPISS